jgi:hypothetical protein
MTDYGLDKWRGSIARIEHANEDAQEREVQRDMLSYLKSLACTNGLRSMGVWLKNEEPMPAVQASLPPLPPSPAAAAAAAAEPQQQQSLQGEMPSQAQQHPVTMKSTQENCRIVGVKRKVEFAIENNSIGKLGLAADKVMKRRKTFVQEAHEEYMAGLLACMCHSPFGIRQYLSAYENFMRIAGAAELSLYEI